VDAQLVVTVTPVALSFLAYAAMHAVCAFGVARARAAPKLGLDRAPRISILKPLAGADDDLEANLASFAALDYPDYEILFGVASHADSALPIAKRFIAAHPHLAARVVVTDPDNAINPKVAQLIDLDRKATGEVLVISDSNVRVAPAYLWSLVRELEAPGAGIVTSIFVGSGEETMGAALENLQLCGVTAPGIVATNLATSWKVTIGKSMAMRRRDLAKLGGFGRFGALLAEDQVLGDTFGAAGFGVRTSLEVVHNRNTTCSVRRTVERHTRWSKLRRSLYPVGYLFEPLLSPLTVASIVAVLMPSQLAMGAVAAAALMQTVVAMATTAHLRGHGLAWRYAPLEIVRTYLQLLCWATALVSMRIQWRGHPFVLKPGSVIAPAPPSAWAGLRARVRGTTARA
jgi:ceramide glucosyltransferase